MLVGDMSVNGVIKEITAPSHRHEVHFTINNRVESTSDGRGNWDDVDYMIVDDFGVHENEMDNDNMGTAIAGLSPSDSWTRGTSIELSKDAVIMVKKGVEIPLSDDELKKYKIVYFEGDPTKCLRNFLNLNGYKVFHTDKNAAGHAHSILMQQENICDQRDQIISYVTDNQNGANESFNLQNILNIIDCGIDFAADYSDISRSYEHDFMYKGIVNERFGSFSESFNYYISDSANDRSKILVKHLMEKGLIDKEQISAQSVLEYLKVAGIVTTFGIKKEGNEYSLKSDEEILGMMVKKIKEGFRIDSDEKREAFLEDVNFNLIDDLFLKVRDLRRQHETERAEPILEGTLSMPFSELYRYENHIECEKIVKILPSGYYLSYSEEGVNVSKHIDGNRVFNKKISKNACMADLLEICRAFDEQSKEIETKGEKAPPRNVGMEH